MTSPIFFSGSFYNELTRGTEIADINADINQNQRHRE
jgi:hypothetical protein